jgi:hypothetical protein
MRSAAKKHLNSLLSMNYETLAQGAPSVIAQPTLAPALIVGLGSIVVPFFIMQPGLGAGVAASRTPKPWRSRFRSLVTHTSFAIGLYLSALLLSPLHRMIQA